MAILQCFISTPKKMQFLSCCLSCPDIQVYEPGGRQAAGSRTGSPACIEDGVRSHLDKISEVAIFLLWFPRKSTIGPNTAVQEAPLDHWIKSCFCFCFGLMRGMVCYRMSFLSNLEHGASFRGAGDLMATRHDRILQSMME